MYNESIYKIMYDFETQICHNWSYLPFKMEGAISNSDKLSFSMYFEKRSHIHIVPFFSEPEIYYWIHKVIFFLLKC